MISQLGTIDNFVITYGLELYYCIKGFTDFVHKLVCPYRFL